MKSALIFLALFATVSSMCIWHRWACNKDNGCGSFYGCSFGCEEGRCASSCMGACAAIEFGKYPEGCCTECKEWCYLEGADGGDIACNTNADCVPYKNNECNGRCAAF